MAEDHRNVRDFPWWLFNKEGPHILVLGSKSKIPANSKAEVEFLDWQQLRSLIIVPLIIDGTVSGFMGLENILDPMMQKHPEVELLRVFSNILANSIKRLWSEDALRRSEAQLINSGRLASLAEMATGVAHELNQPLAIIRAQAEIMKMENEELGDEDEDSAKDVDLIMSEVDRAAKIINYMREFAGVSTASIEPINLSEVITESLIFFREQFRLLRINLGINFDDNIPTINMDTQKMEQVVFNLLSNAKYAVEQRQDDADKDYQKRIDLELSYDSDFKTVRFMVTDNGVGMSPFELERCFDPFFTTRAVGEGMGLGLAIIHNIVRGYHGRVDVLSSREEGTSIWVELPIDPS